LDFAVYGKQIRNNLSLTATGELMLVDDNESHETAAKAYFDWWENNKQKDFSEFNFIDPLKDTGYRWH